MMKSLCQGDARGGLARIRPVQTFFNPYPEPLRVTYALALPPEAAVSGFLFSVGEQRIVGEIDLRSRARERFEQALVEGRSAALLAEDRSTLFRQEVGNIPPETEVRVEISIRPAARLAPRGRRGRLGVALPHRDGASLPGRGGAGGG